MRIAVIGDDGGLAGQVVGQALAHGHEVVALGFVSQAHAVEPGYTGHAGDPGDLEAVRGAIGGCDVVACVPSLWSAACSARYAASVPHVVYAMAEHGVSRLVAMSAAGSFSRSDKRLPIGMRLSAMFGSAGTVFDHAEEIERRIAASSLDWTIVRTGALTSGEPTGRYRVSLEGTLLPKTRGVSTQDAASFVMKALGGYTYVRRTVLISD